MDLDALVCIGGDGTLGISYEFYKRGIPLVVRAKDNRQRHRRDQQLLRLRHRCQLCDDGHRSAAHHGRSPSARHGGRGDGALRRLDCAARGVAGGADVILIPEIPYDRRRSPRPFSSGIGCGARFSIVVVAEGAHPIHGSHSVVEAAHGGHAERLGGAGKACADEIGGSPARRHATSCWAICSAAASRPHSTARSRRVSAARRWS